MGRKKRAPIEELRKVKQIADELLVDKGIILPHQQSAIARIFNSEDAPILPGIPAYLPYPWTINATRRVLYDLTKEWQFHTKNDENLHKDISEFFRYVISGLEKEHSKVKKMMLESAMKQEYDLSLLRKKDAYAGVAKFLVDSFVVAVAEKSCADIPEYLEWFLRWTDALLRQWSEKARQIDAKPTSGQNR